MKVKRRKFAVMNFKMVNQFELILLRMSLFLVFLTVLSPNNGVSGYYDAITLDFGKNPQVTRTLKSSQDALYIEVDNSYARPGVEYQVSILLQNLRADFSVGNSSGADPWVKMKGYSRKGGIQYFQTNLAILASGPYPDLDPGSVPVPASIPVQYFGRSVNVWANGSWGPGDEARVIATIFYERQSCSDCPQTTPCCSIRSKCDGTGTGNENRNRDTDQENRMSQNAQKITREFNIEAIQFRKLMEERNRSGEDAVEDVLTIIVDSDSDSDLNFNSNSKNVKNSERSSQTSKSDNIMQQLGYWNSGFGLQASNKEVVNNARCFPWGFYPVCDEGSGSGTGTGSDGSSGNCSVTCGGDGNGTSGDCGCGSYWQAHCMNNSIVATILLTVFFFLLTPVVLSFLLCYHRQMGLFSFRQPPPPPPPTVSSPVDDLPPTHEEIEEPPPCFCTATSTMNLYDLDEIGTGTETGRNVTGNRPISLSLPASMVENQLDGGGVLNPGFASYFPPPTPPTSTSLNISIPCSCGRGSETMGRNNSNSNSDSKWSRFSFSARNLMSRVSPSRFILPGRIRTVSHGRIRGSTSSQLNIIMNSHGSDLDDRPSSSSDNSNNNPGPTRPTTGSLGSMVGFNSDNYSNYIV